MNRSRLLLFLVVLALLVPMAASAVPYDRPVMASEVQGQAKIVAIVVAGPSGAPAGFTVQWMRYSDYLANGAHWYDAPNSFQVEAAFWGVPTLNTWGGLLTSFLLDPSAVAAVEIGDLFDETGVTVSSVNELVADTKYIFRCLANGDANGEPSAWSNNYLIDTTANTNCTYTQGFWKTHPEAWDGISLTLGTVLYTQAELLAILNQPAQGNGLIILAHQLIALELNILQGADTTDVDDARAAAHLLIGSLVVPPVGTDYLDPSETSGLTQVLDDYNNGIIGPGHCGSVSVKPSTWGGTKAAYR